MNTIYFNKNNIILIDSSYYVFHRYFATYRWFSFQNINVSVDDIINNNIFINAFYKHINNDIKKLCKKWNENELFIPENRFHNSECCLLYCNKLDNNYMLDFCQCYSVNVVS